MFPIIQLKIVIDLFIEFYSKKFITHSLKNLKHGPSFLGNTIQKKLLKFKPKDAKENGKIILTF